MAKSVMLDAGHGGADPGAVYKGRQEKDDNLKLVMAVGNILKDKGVDVRYTRTEDVYQTPFEKAQIANNAGVDYLISFHRNSSPKDNQYEGAEVLVYDDTGDKKVLAEDILKELEDEGFKNLGVKERPGLVVLRRSKMPAVLIETGFLNNDEDNKNFDSNFDAIAEGIANAILNVVEQDESEEDGMADGSQNQGEQSSSGMGGNVSPGISYYRVQVGAYRDRKNADTMLYELLEQDFPAYIIMQDGYYKVQVGAYQQFGNAVAMEQRLRMAGYPTVLVM